MIINNIEDEMELVIINLRVNIIGGVINCIYVYFNEDMELVMFEDYIFMYYIFNDGMDVIDNVDWWFVIEVEIVVFKVVVDFLIEMFNIRLVYVRVVKDIIDV